MSDIQNDKLPLEEGRKAPLSDVDAPLRDRIVQKLFDKLDELNIGQKVCNLWDNGLARRSLWNERQQAWLSSWDEHLIPDTEGAFSGSSQLHIPMPFIVCKTLHARFLQALWQDPPFSIRAQNEASTERVEVVRDVLRYYLMRGANYNKGIGRVIDLWLWDWITMGSGVLKMRWDVKYTRYIDVQPVEEEGPPVVRVIDGKETFIPTKVMVDKEVARTKKCFDGPVFELVDLEDLVIVGGNGDPDDADAVLQREFLTASQLWTLADRKIFNADAVRDVIDGGPDSINGSVGSETKTQRAQNAGQAQSDSDQDLDRYEIIEAYLQVDVDGSGINSDVVVWVHKKSRALLRATYLFRVSKTGERPYAKIDFQSRKGQEFAVGMVELLYPLSKELDAIHNMRIDFGLISVMPFGFYRPTSGIDPTTIQLEPGALIPVDNPQTDVFFPNLGNRTTFGFQEEQAIQSMIERLTSISDLSLGLMTSQGATRTATGARALVGEMSSNLDVYLRRLNFGWEKANRYTLHQLQQRIPPGLSFRLTGNDGQDYWRQIRNADDIAGDFDIEVSANSASSNEAVQQEKANQILQLVFNPLAIQMGAVTPANIYNALENRMRSMQIRDFGKYVTKPQGPLRVFTPEEEANRILRGIFVPVTPEMDHQGFIDFFNMIFDNDELLGQFNEEQTVMLAAQAKKHEQMMAAIQQMQAQAANATQMQMNAGMAQNQTSLGPQGAGPVGNGAPPVG
jgi:hypothetical protein